MINKNKYYMDNIVERITDIIKNSSPELAAEEILDLFGVSQKRELLKAFIDFYNYRNTKDKTINNDEIEIFIDSLKFLNQNK